MATTTILFLLLTHAVMAMGGDNVKRPQFSTDMTQSQGNENGENRPFIPLAIPTPEDFICRFSVQKLYRDWFIREEPITSPHDLRPGHAVSFSRSTTLGMRGIYHHWAIVTGVSETHITLIHYQSTNEPNTKARIRQDTFTIEHFFSGDPVSRLNFGPVASITSLEEVVKRAKEHLGDTGYNLILRNCQHFVQYCYGFQEPLALVYHLLVLVMALFIINFLVSFGCINVWKLYRYRFIEPQRITSSHDLQPGNAVVIRPTSTTLGMRGISKQWAVVTGVCGSQITLTKYGEIRGFWDLDKLYYYLIPVFLIIEVVLLVIQLFVCPFFLPA